MRTRYPIAVLALIATAFIWTTDKVALEGERTVYSVDCRNGTWQGTHCSGQLSAADRFRFRALPPHREVVFWTAGSSAPSGKYTECDIKDGRNWTCKPNDDASRTVTLRMASGVPVPDKTGRTRSYRAVDKWRWYFLQWGLPAGSDADMTSG